MPAFAKTLTACAAVVVMSVAAAAPASARVVEVGQVEPRATPSCPSPCIAISRTTGYQARVGERRRVVRVPEDGRIVAWTITLGKPGAQQKRFFDRGFGGTASAGITVLRLLPKKRTTSRVVGQSPVLPVEGYFGQTVQFPLTQTIAVRKGDIVALTVPTWAPALAVGLGEETSWRASRARKPRSQCLDTETQTALTSIGREMNFQCLYETARLAYSATLVTDPPAPTPPPEEDDEAERRTRR